MCGTHNPIASCNTVHSKHSKYYKDPEISVLRAMLHLKTSALLRLVDYEVQMASMCTGWQVEHRLQTMVVGVTRLLTATALLAS